MVHPKAKRQHFILSIWSQGGKGDIVWRGSLETAVGERYYFSSLKQLNTLLIQFGWLDPTDHQLDSHTLS